MLVSSPCRAAKFKQISITSAAASSRADRESPRDWRGMAEAAKEVAKSSILLRAPDGEVDWTIIELQGTVEPRNGLSLDNVELGSLKRDAVRCCRRRTSLAPSAHKKTAHSRES